MKQIRIIFGLLALTIAIGGAVAASVHSEQPVVYYYYDATWPEPNQCVLVELECVTNAEYPCKVLASGPTLRSSSSASTECGIELARTSAPGAGFQK